MYGVLGEVNIPRLDALEIHLESALKSFELNQETMRSIVGWD
ncbi:MAG: hypothetical protein ABL887_10295 [Nitrosomonas sp.]